LQYHRTIFCVRPSFFEKNLSLPVEISRETTIWSSCWWTESNATIITSYLFGTSHFEHFFDTETPLYTPPIREVTFIEAQVQIRRTNEETLVASGSNFQKLAWLYQCK
jgi:hypothetical protein